MKKASLLFLLLITSINYLKAQQEKIILKAGSSLQDFKIEHVYKYPAFINSKVNYKDGLTTNENLNYNQISGKMEFISKSGDTLNITNNDEIQSVVIDKRSFYYDNGYYEIIKETPEVNLARKVSVRLVDKQRIGAYGMASSTTAIDSYATVPNDMYYTKLKVNVDHIFYKTTTYFLADSSFHFIPATQKNLLKTAKEKKEAINSYLKTNQVDFNNREQIEDLLNHIQTH